MKMMMNMSQIPPRPNSVSSHAENFFWIPRHMQSDPWLLNYPLMAFLSPSAGIFWIPLCKNSVKWWCKHTLSSTHLFLADNTDRSVDSITQTRVLKINFLGKLRGSTHSELQTVVPVAFCKKRHRPLKWFTNHVILIQMIPYRTSLFTGPFFHMRDFILFPHEAYIFSVILFMRRQ